MSDDTQPVLVPVVPIILFPIETSPPAELVTSGEAPPVLPAIMLFRIALAVLVVPRCNPPPLGAVLPTMVTLVRTRPRAVPFDWIAPPGSVVAVLPTNVELLTRNPPFAAIAPPPTPPLLVLPVKVEFKMTRVLVEKFCIAPPELAAVLFETVQFTIVRFPGTAGVGVFDAELLNAPPRFAVFPVITESEIIVVPPKL